MRMHIVVTLGLLAGAVPAMASEVYRWVDENGVVNFSDAAPGKAQPGAEVNTLTLEDTAPKDYEARREQQRRVQAQPSTPYQSSVNDRYPYDFPAYGRPPMRPPGRPPARPPQRPVPEPYETSTLRPPRQAPDPNGG